MISLEERRGNSRFELTRLLLTWAFSLSASECNVDKSYRIVRGLSLIPTDEIEEFGWLESSKIEDAL